MRALSVRQPWATLIQRGWKTVEVRSWSTRYRGPLLIVSARAVSRHPAAGDWQGTDWPRGVTLCVVDLVDVVEGMSEHAVDAGGVDPTGQWSWVLRRVRSVDRVPARGRLGLWDYADPMSLLA